MEEGALLSLAGWESYYVIIGAAAAALTGLQFVVLTLTNERNLPGSGSATSAFGTPTIVHFCAALLISAVLSAPWPALTGIGIVIGIGGVVGFVYMLLVVRQALRQTDYVPVLEDWIWHGALPLIAYAALLVAAVFISSDTIWSLFTISGVALLLLFIGIHNSWDSVVYIALREPQPEPEPERHTERHQERHQERHRRRK